MDVVFDFLFSRWFGVPLLFGIGFWMRREGLYRIGYERLHDERSYHIKDREIWVLWRKLGRLNHNIGWWYSRIIGPYFMWMAAMAFVLLWVLKWELSNWFSEERALLWPVALLAILAGVMCHCANPIQEPFGNRRRTMGLDIEIYKDTVYTLYQRIAVQHDYWQLGDKAKDQFHLDWLRFAPKLMVMGAILWYGIMMTWAAALLILTLHDHVFG